ncbi:MAG: sodium:solute symporter family protein [Bacteroidota bacterium]
MNISNILLSHPLIPLFFVVNLVIGWWAHRKAKANSFEDYALASRDLPTGVLIMTILATLISASELILVDIIVDCGFVEYITTFLQFAISTLFIGIFIAPQLVHFDEPTFGGVMGKLYGQGVQLLAGSIHFLLSLLLLATQIGTIGILSSKLLGMDFSTGVLFFGGIIVLYSALGGMRAVSYTDVLQLMMVFIVLFWITQKAMLQTGGLSKMIKKVAEQDEEMLSFVSNPHFFTRVKAWLYYNLFSFAFVMSPPLVHRMLMVKDKSKVTRMWYNNVFIYGVIATMIFIIGLAGSLILKEQEKHNALIHMVKNLFEGQPWMIDIMSLALIGILLSTIDSFLHTMGIILTRDIFVPLKRLLGSKEVSERSQLNFAKIGILLMGILTVLIGSKIEHISSRLIERKLVRPAVALQVIVTIPFILGVMGLKTDRGSFLSFGIAYLSVFYGQKVFFPWQAVRLHRADYDYFLIALPVGILAYFVTHIYVNGGIATAERGKNYTAMGLWRPQGANLWLSIQKQLKGIFNLAQQARQAMVQRPAHPLVFSIFMFALYGLGSGIGVSDDPRVSNLMATIYLIGVSLCAGMMIEGIWPFSLKPYFPLYWFVTLFFCLPLGGTLAFLCVHEGLANILFVTNFALLALLVSSRAFFWMSLGGNVLAWGGWYLVMGDLPKGLWSEKHIGGYVGLAIVALSVFFLGHYFEMHMAQQIYLKQVFGHAVTHESRQPLTEISIVSRLQDKAMKELKPIKSSEGEDGFFILKENLASIERGSKQIRVAIADVQSELIRFRKVMGEEISQIPPLKQARNFVPVSIKRHSSTTIILHFCPRGYYYDLFCLFILSLREGDVVKHGSGFGLGLGFGFFEPGRTSRLARLLEARAYKKL